MKKVDIVSKIVGRDGEGTRAPSPSAASASVDLSGYLKKEVWDDVWEVRETEEGTRYVLGKLPMVMRYGMTMYAEDESLNLPGIYDGLPIDGETIYWEETDTGKVLKAKGGGTGGGSIEYPLSWSGFSSGSYDGSAAKSIYIPSKVSELTNDSSFITSSALSGYATETWVNGKGFITSSALNGYATESYVTSRGYITSSALSGYATESWVNGKGYLTSSSLNGYATESYVTSRGYITSSALSGYATQSWVTGKGYIYKTNWFGVNADSSVNPYIMFNNEINVKFYVQTVGNYIYIGSTDSKSFRISKDGDCLSMLGISMYSDARKKTIINHVQLSLKEVANAPLIEYYYNSDERKTTHVGSIAQYWAGLNDWFCKTDDKGYYTMEIQNAALASAISIARELVKYETKTDKQIRRLKKRINQLEDEIEKLKTA